MHTIIVDVAGVRPPTACTVPVMPVSKRRSSNGVLWSVRYMSTDIHSERDSLYTAKETIHHRTLHKNAPPRK